MPVQMHIDASEMKKLATKLRSLSKRQSRSIVRRGLQAGSTPALKQFRANVRAHDGEYSTGVLGKAIGRKTTTSRRTGQSYVVIGAIRGVRVQADEPDGREVIRQPSRYLHLLELGSETQAPTPLLQAAVESTKAEVQQRTIEYLNKGITRALRQQLKRNGSASGMALVDLAEND